MPVREFLRGVIGSDPRLWVILHQQNDLILEQGRARERDQIGYARNLCQTLEAVRTAILEDVPEEILIAKLDSAIKDLRDTVARDSEHVL